MRKNRMTALVAVLALGCGAMTRAHGEESKEKQQMHTTINMPAPAGESTDPPYFTAGPRSLSTCALIAASSFSRTP